MSGGQPIELVAYDEFALFHENAEEYGLPYPEPPVVRREVVTVADGRRLSALVWGEGEPELVFLHGGAQNAHTWDTVAMALGRPLVALDLPGHGHSDGPRHSAVGVRENAVDVTAAILALAPDAAGVVGMSLGGMTTLALAAHAPELVRSMVLVDVTPGVNAAKSQAISAFINGPASFASFADLLARTIEHNPTRTVSSLRRGILHNAEQRADGSWVWRYARHRQQAEEAGEPSSPLIGSGAGHPDFAELWHVVDRLAVPVLLVRGMRPQSVVDDADEAELLRRCATASVVRLDGSGHSVQGDEPVELARLIEEFCLAPEPGG